jgi:hypothetical protein
MTDQPEDTKPQIEYESVPVQQPPPTLEKVRNEIDRIGFKLADVLDVLITDLKTDWPAFEKQVRFFFSREFWDTALSTKTKSDSVTTSLDGSNSTEGNSNTAVSDSQSVSPQLKTASVDVNKLGYHLDGWADLLEGMGERVSEVQKSVLDFLVERDMPEIGVFDVIGHASLSSNERRSYLLTTTHPGATTAIYIASHGKDLYVSWRTFINRILNWGMILMVIFIAFLISFIYEAIRISSSTYRNPTISITEIMYIFIIVLAT